VDTALGRFEGGLGDPRSHPAAGTAVTLSIRPECWKLSRERAETNAISGRIGESLYLGELAQYEFISAGVTLKIFEMNPRFFGAEDRGELYAAVLPADVVVLTA
jgi:iron(III) transport system ATP-binding protein